ncbi:glycosyltransferase family 39 protein [Collimonas antrihumi]|uniref:glycosyltransferase family 39 protein n=1 Tax=Collimonas antrihumi TaxID=1940615 RepID=UPI001B8BEAA4|nr:glycosyltransferase family 39 protein [Collimonas antrihumi]
MMAVLTTLYKTLQAKETLKREQTLVLSFAGAVFIHVMVWTLLPMMLQNNASLDMVEGLAWGREWQLGYEKDPPLFAWVIELITTWSNKGLWISYLAGQLCVATVFFSVWQLGRRIATDAEALVGALLLEGVYYFNFPTPEFNDIVLQMPFAALFGWLLHKAITGNRLTDWFLSGIVASLGLWSRYSMGAYLLPLALFMIAHPVARRRLASPGPWILVLTSTLLFLPHLYWIVKSGFVSIEYVGRRAPEITKITAFLKCFLSFLGAQLLALLPMLLMAIMLWRWKSSRTWLQLKWKNFDQAYVTTLALGPIAISLFLSIITARPLRAMWGAPLWCFGGLFIVMAIRPALTTKRLRYFGRAWFVVLLLPIAFFILDQLYAPKITGNEKRTHFPGTELAQTVADRWHAAIKSPLKYVAGDTWYAGNISFYSSERPSTMFSHGSFRFSPWIDPQDLKRSGAVLIWDATHEGDAIPAALATQYTNAMLQPPVTLDGDVSVYRIGLAFVTPKTLENLETIEHNEK